MTKRSRKPVGGKHLLIDRLHETVREHPDSIVLAKVNNRLRSLHEIVDANARIEWIRLESPEGRRSYQQTLCLILLRAAEELFPEKKLLIDHSLGKGLYCQLLNEEPCTDRIIGEIKNQMLEIISANEPVIPESDACPDDKTTRTNKNIIRRAGLLPYRCGNTIACMNYPLLPLTGWLKTFDLRPREPGMILCLPDEENINVLPPFENQEKLFQVFHEYGRWLDILGIETPEDINRAIQTGEIGDLVKIAEGLHEKKIAYIADEIQSGRKERRIILIAGPSSSGKTTFIKRLEIQLRVNGMRPMAISLDDYFLDRDKTPRDKEGNPDFESLRAIDVERFNRDLEDLLAGGEVRLPRFDFVAGKSMHGGLSRLAPGEPVLIEGLHGLNDALTPDIPQEHKYKIYVSALTQLNLMPHLRIPTSDVRLLRRLIRGFKFRGHHAEATLTQWQLVRMGEEKYIFPFQEDADVIFNSSIVYELNVLRTLTAPLLEAVPEDHDCFPEAERILRLLFAFDPITPDEVPRNSILREYIGDSAFRY